MCGRFGVKAGTRPLEPEAHPSFFMEPLRTGYSFLTRMGVIWTYEVPVGARYAPRSTPEDGKKNRSHDDGNS